MSNASSASADLPPDSPLAGIVADVLARLHEVADQPDAKITCNSLIELLGGKSHALAILVFSLLNLLPGPPGYSVVIGLAIMAFSVMMMADRPIRLWSFVGDRRLPLGLMLKLLEFLARFTRVISRFSKARFTWMASRGFLPFVAIFAFLLGGAMLFPIPFTNTLPSLGLAIICVGILNKDGVAMMLGTVIALIGVVLLYVCLWLIFVVGLAVGEAVVDEVDDLRH
ncbi:exopolysaccharide biosynthesis protein [Paradevosia shaoguanensis]|uniref:exopolysaccharide biosynthesis protein n=1 Tax=Paradevosia shaoguanensis TaxID=1335043 RepID=UPI003C78B4D4